MFFIDTFNKSHPLQHDRNVIRTPVLSAGGADSIPAGSLSVKR